MHREGRVVPFATRPVVAALLTAVAYWLGTHVGLLLTPSDLAVSLMWPPNALLMASLLLAPVRYWPWYVAAVLPVHLLTQLWHGIPLLTSIGWFLTNASEAVLGAYLLRRLRSPRELFQTFGGVLIFLAVGVAGTTALTSFLDAAVVVGTGMGTGYWNLWCHRFASNSLSMLTLIPPIVTIAASSVRRFRDVRRVRYLEASLLALAALFVIDLMFARHQTAQATIPELTYTVLPLMFWAAVRFGPTGVSLLQLFSTAAILWTALKITVVSIEDVLPLQMFLLMLNGLSLSLAVVVNESRRFQSLHSAVLRSMRKAVAITDPDGVVIDANDAWIATVHSPDECRLDGIALHANYLAHHRVKSQHDSVAGRMVTGLEGILAGTRNLFEMDYVCRSGDETKWFSITVVPLWGDQRGAVITHTDITRRKREETETLRLREELAHAGRVMTMGMLSATLTHEMSQPLAAILANAQTARRFCARGEEGDREEVDLILDDIVAASRRAGSILQRLRNWFSNGRHESERLGLNDVANDVIEILRGDLLRRGVTVARRLAPELPAINGDRVQLQQVVLNLILNACDAMRDNAAGDRHVLVMTAPCDEGVRLSVEDIGTGIAPDQLHSVFEPFVTTKTTGLGLGLALCRSIVQAHEGQLTAENNPTRGVTFHCILPLADEHDHNSVATEDRRRSPVVH
jgi:signal transduction histidine kinase/integral membrane sensor domain MASE1